MNKLRIASSWSSRVVGLLGKDPRRDVLLLAPCHDVHTVGMKYPIDIAFVDERGRVMESHRDVAPGRRLRCGKASAVLERKACKYPWYQAGEILSLTAPSPVLPVSEAMDEEKFEKLTGRARR